jgi:hypothetical protein
VTDASVQPGPSGGLKSIVGTVAGPVSGTVQDPGAWVQAVCFTPDGQVSGLAEDYTKGGISAGSTAPFSLNVLGSCDSFLVAANAYVF